MSKTSKKTISSFKKNNKSLDNVKDKDEFKVNYYKKRRKKRSSVFLPSQKEKTYYKHLSDCEGILRGHPAFLLGNAPSISDKKLQLVDKYFTIGINRIFYIYSPTVLIWQDIGLWKTNKKDIIKSKSVKMCRDISDPRKIYLNFKLAQDPFKFKMTPHRLHGRGNTGLLAAEMAVSLGCSSLILIGMDGKYDKKGKTDFYGKNDDHGPKTVLQFQKSMDWLEKNCPIPIYNCSKNKFWPEQKLADVIDKIQPPKGNKKYFREKFLKDKNAKR
jgi:hypothetical protein